MSKKNKREIEQNNIDSVMMDIDEKLIKLLDGELSEEEIHEVEQILDTHPDVKEDKELYEQILLRIRIKGELDLKSELDDYLKEYLSKQQSKIRPFNTSIIYSGIAASLTLVILFFYIKQNNTSQNEPIQLQINEAPIHADSATLKPDSLESFQDTLKTIQK